MKYTKLLSLIVLSTGCIETGLKSIDNNNLRGDETESITESSWETEDILSPELSISLNEVGFGLTHPTCEEYNTLEISNTGDANLTVYSITSNDQEFSFFAELPIELEPAEAYLLDVSFLPETVDNFEGELIFSSNDPAGDQSVIMTGEASEYVHTQSWTEATTNKTDILFVLDHSNSMIVELGILRNLMDEFSTHLNDNVADWQIIFPSLNDGCNNNGVISEQTQDYDEKLWEGVWYNWGAHLEELFLIATYALDKTSSGQCNEGFLRPDANLHVFFASDEPEQSNITSSEMYNTLVNIKGDPSKVRVTALYNYGDNTGKYQDMVDRTGGLDFDVMEDEWTTDSSIEDIASHASGTRSYSLELAPVVETITVTIDGVVSDSWVYNPTSQSIEFTIPHGGAEVVAEYVAASQCD